VDFKAKPDSPLKRMLLESLKSGSESPDIYQNRISGVPDWTPPVSNSSKVINWYIENLPQGKQTIIVL
jgi:hypothetical protein